MSCFKLNEEIYKAGYLPYYDEEPKRLIQFSIMLPYFFPINDDMAFTIKYENVFFTYDFKKEYKDENYLYKMLDVESNILKRPISRVEMTYAEIDKNLNDDEEYISLCFDKLLKSLNNIMLAYKIKMKCDDVYLIRKEMLAATIMYRIINPENWIDTNKLFLLHFNVPTEQKLLNSSDLDEVLRHCDIVFNELNPFINTVDYLVDANRLLRTGFFEDTVIHANIAIESYVRNLFRYFIVFENQSSSQNEIEEKIENTAFITMIKKEMSKRLGGSWDFTRNNTPIYNWYEYTYLLRNKIVHGARRIEYKEAYDSIKYANEFLSWINSLIKQKKKQYVDLYEFIK